MQMAEFYVGNKEKILLYLKILLFLLIFFNCKILVKHDSEYIKLWRKRTRIGLRPLRVNVEMLRKFSWVVVWPLVSVWLFLTI